MFKILFVCTGNTCRSVMAEWIFNQKIRERSLENQFKADSAGVAAMPGSPASKHSITVIEKLGGDLSDHKSQKATVELVSGYDLVLTMTEDQKHLLEKNLALAQDKGNHPPVHLLKTYVKQKDPNSTQTDQPNDKTINDPIGGTQEEYQDVFDELSAWIDRLIDSLVENVEKK